MMGIELPFGMALWPMLIGGVVSGFLIDTWASQNGYGHNPMIAIPVIAAAFICGKVGGWIAGVGVIGVFRALWIVFIFSVFIGLIVLAFRSHFRFRTVGDGGGAHVHVQVPATGAVPPLQNPAGNSSGVNTMRAGIMYHATPEIQHAMDICMNKRFKVGPSTPLGFYLSPDFSWASTRYSGKSGAVVEFTVAFNLQLKEKSDTGNIYYYHTPNADVGDYQDFPLGLKPVRLLDWKGFEIQRVI